MLRRQSAVATTVESGGFSDWYQSESAPAFLLTGLLASEDGKTYGKFDVGEGIEAGGTMTLAWDKSTDKFDCHLVV